jgi:hypothetical protein
MRIARSAAAISAGLALGACATLFGGGSNQAVNLSSTPPASFTVKSSSGLQMAQGMTPFVAQLPRKNEYQIQITANGYQPQTLVLTKGINGWFWVNLLLGGVVGMAIDLVSGAAWKLEPAIINVSLQRGEDLDELFSCIKVFDANGKLLGQKVTKLAPAR